MGYEDRGTDSSYRGNLGDGPGPTLMSASTLMGNDVLIGAAQPWRLIGQQKNTRMAKLASGSPAPRDKTC